MGREGPLARKTAPPRGHHSGPALRLVSERRPAEPSLPLCVAACPTRLSEYGCASTDPLFIAVFLRFESTPVLVRVEPTGERDGRPENQGGPRCKPWARCKGPRSRKSDAQGREGCMSPLQWTAKVPFLRLFALLRLQQTAQHPPATVTVILLAPPTNASAPYCLPESPSQTLAGVTFPSSLGSPQGGLVDT